MVDTNQAFVESETQRIYAEYKRQACTGGLACGNDSKPSTVEAFNKASESLVADFVEATRGIV
jgi:phosphoglucomutase